MRTIWCLGLVVALALFAAACTGSAPAPGAAKDKTTAGDTAKLEKTKTVLGWGMYAGNDVANRLPVFAKMIGLDL